MNVDSFYFPVEIETLAALFPIDLKDSGCYLLTLMMESQKLDALVTAVSQLQIGPTGSNTPLYIDCRRGLVFHVNGERLEVFVDGLGDSAYVNGRLVKIDSSLIRFLNDNFKPCFQ